MNLLVDTLCFNFIYLSVVVFAAISFQLNHLELCIADSDFEEAREDTLSYSA